MIKMPVNSIPGKSYLPGYILTCLFLGAYTWRERALSGVPSYKDTNPISSGLQLGGLI